MDTNYKKQVTHKIWIGTLTKLRMMYALTGENMSSIIDKLISTELKKLLDNRDSQNDNHPHV